MQLAFNIVFLILLIANLCVTLSHRRMVKAGAQLVAAARDASDKFESLRKVNQHGS